MAERLQFREKLAGILEICEEKKRVIDKREVEEYFGEEELSREQMELVFDYLLSNKVIVNGYVKAGGTVIPAVTEKVEPSFSSEEEQYLRIYEQDLSQMAEDDSLAELLPEIVIMAKEMHTPEIFIGDLIQEGNMGLLLAMEQYEGEKEKLLFMAKESMQALIESQKETKLRDKRMVDKVNNLDEQIKKITGEMGRKVSVDELSELLQISEEEIGDILRLAGEEPEE